ncbi:MAG: hypothetical protein V1797_18270 [Pseudomonadota bacterium]
MHILCYLPGELSAAHPVRRLLLNSPSQCTREIYDSISGLERRLARPGEPDLVLALALTSEPDLDRILALAQFCLQRDLLLILPHPEPSLEAKAHRLRPRYITYLDGDPDDLCAVLDRLAHVYENVRGESSCKPMLHRREPGTARASRGNS